MYASPKSVSVCVYEREVTMCMKRGDRPFKQMPQRAADVLITGPGLRQGEGTPAWHGLLEVSRSCQNK